MIPHSRLPAIARIQRPYRMARNLTVSLGMQPKSRVRRAAGRGKHEAERKNMTERLVTAAPDGAYQLVTSLTWCGYLVMAVRTRWRPRGGTAYR